MIIGLAGYMSSGKDLTGSIIQYLTSECSKSKRTHYRTFEQWLQRGQGDNSFQGWYQSEWEIKKFAGKLKQIASLLTGISIEKFEDQEFKKTYLDDKWLGNWSDYDRGEAVPSVRFFLQKLGTESLRDGLHKDVWVNALFSEWIQGPDYQEGTTPENLKWREGDFPKWVVTDCRFPNEAQAIKDRGGIIIRINREIYSNTNDCHIWETNQNNTGDKYTYDKDYYSMKESLLHFREEISKDKHSSETSLDDWKFDYVINNDGSIDDLVEKVRTTIGSYL